jgi:sulfatase maturation enzyme AslB (radical SAM superfamily)
MHGPEEINQLNLILTSKCNLNCLYCYQNAKKSISMDWETVRYSIDMLIDSIHGNLVISFLGGEPLLEFGMIQRAVEYTENNMPTDKEIEYGISTNGTLMDREIASFLSKYRFDTQLSFDGLPEAQDFRGRGTFETLDQLLDKLREDYSRFYCQNLKVVITLSPLTIRHLSGSIDYLISKGILDISISPVITNPAGWNDNLIEALDSQFRLILASSIHHYEETGRIPVNLFRDRYLDSQCTSDNKSMCGVPYGHGLVVDADGQTYGCPVFAGSYQEFNSPFMLKCFEELRMGKINHPEFPELFSRFPLAAHRLGIFHHKDSKYSSYGLCDDCEYYSQCSVCPASIPHVPGNSDPHRVSDFACAFNMVSLKYRALFPVGPDPVETVLGYPPGAHEEIERWKNLANGFK